MTITVKNDKQQKQQTLDLMMPKTDRTHVDDRSGNVAFNAKSDKTQNNAQVAKLTIM
jgi:hypothetical protein